MTWKRRQLVNLKAMSLLAINHRDKGEPPVSNKFMRRLLNSYRFASRQDWQVNFESSETRDEIALSDYLDPGDDNLNPEELGRRIDDCLVHHIEVYTGCLIDGAYSIEEFNLVMDKIQEGMKEDSDYQAFAASLQERNLRPASDTYLELVRLYILYGGKRRPYWELGREFAVVHMEHVRNDHTWKVDWDRERVTECLAEAYLGDPDPVLLQRFIDNSVESRLAWEILCTIMRKAVSTGVDPPKMLVTWYVTATSGYPNRPDWRTGPRNRRRVLGRILRDNEIRDTASLLALAGMKETEGSSVVASALRLDGTYVHRIYNRPKLNMVDLAAHAIDRLDPSVCLSPREIWPRLQPYLYHVAPDVPLPALSPSPN